MQSGDPQTLRSCLDSELHGKEFKTNAVSWTSGGLMHKLGRFDSDGEFKIEGTAFGTALPCKSNWEKVSTAGGFRAWDEAIVIHRGQVMPSSEIHAEGVCPHAKYNGKLLHIFWAVFTPALMLRMDWRAEWVRLWLWFNNTWQSLWERAWPQLSAISFFTSTDTKVFWN